MSKKILSVVTTLVVIATVLVGAAAVNNAGAQTVSCANIDAMLSALGVTGAAQIAQAKVAFGCGAATPAAAYTFTRNLTIGSTGADVTALQTKLGVSPATGYFGAITKAAVVVYQTANGIVPASGYVGPLTLAKLNYVAPVVVVPPTTGGTTGSTLEGGAGDLDLSDTSTGVENSLKEGEENVKVLGMKAEADGSDIEVTSIKVTLVNNATTTSEKLSNYLDEVTVYMGSKKVGSADVSDFTKNSATPDTFTKTISLSGAVVNDNDDDKIYVAVSAVSNIDTEDIGASWNVDVNTVRFTDATGAILTASLTAVDPQNFTLTDGAGDDQIDIKSSSANPDNANVTVDENGVTDDELALVFKLDVADDSSDVMITSLPVVLTLTGTGTSTDSIEDVVDSVTVKIGSTSYDADLNVDSVDNGSGTATYVVDFNDDEFVVEAGDVTEVKVYVAFGEQDGNYVEGTTVKASVTGSAIDAETADDSIVVAGGTRAGALLTLDLAGSTISDYRWVVASTGSIVDFYFTVAAETNDITVPLSGIVATSTGSATSSTGTLTRSSGDTVTGDQSAGFVVAEGDTTTFRLSYDVGGANGTWREFTITSVVGKDVPDDKETSSRAIRNVNN